MSSAPAVRTPRVPSIVPLLNPIIRRLLGAGLPFGPNVLLSVRGRSSGELRTFPVAIIEVGDRRYVQSPFGEVNWVRNLRVAGEAVVSRRGKHDTLRAIELGPDEAGRVLQASVAPYAGRRLGAAFAERFLHLRPDATLEQCIDEARTHPMFELSRT